MLDLVVINGKAMGITVRDMVTGKVSSFAGDAVCLCTGGYSNVFYLSTNSMGANVTATYRAYKKGAFFANPCFTQIHPTCIPVSGDHQSKLTLMSESLRNDGRVWVPAKKGDTRSPYQIPEEERDYFLERKYPSYGNLAPRDIASRSAKEVCDAGYGIGTNGRGVYLDFADAMKRLGENVMAQRYGNLFEMYEKITGKDAHTMPMSIYPAPHYTMGGLWVDYNLESTIPGLFVLGEANYSDHGANRLGASGLMQGLADGYFIIPYTLADYLARREPEEVADDHEEFKKSREDVEATVNKLLSINGSKTVNEYHSELGRIMWDHVGMSRSEEGLAKALQLIPELRDEFWHNVKIPGSGSELNQELEKAGRVADFLEFGELMARDALHRNESCGGHFRVEYQMQDGEAKRDDENFCYVGAWEFKGMDKKPELHKELLTFESLLPSIRSYK
jgi:succinate dehydrogenase / fumarate reductase flavoprotein subunit